MVRVSMVMGVEKPPNAKLIAPRLHGVMRECHKADQ